MTITYENATARRSPNGLLHPGDLYCVTASTNGRTSRYLVPDVDVEPIIEEADEWARDISVVLATGITCSILRPADGNLEEALVGGHYTSAVLLSTRLYRHCDDEGPPDMPSRRTPAVLLTSIAEQPAALLPGDDRLSPGFGGAFLWSPDSRFAALNDGGPIPLHDRFLV